MKFLLPILLFFICIHGQQIHIKYLHVRSPIATVEEDLYTNGVNVISKQSENVLFTNSEYPTTKKVSPFYYISQLKNSNKKEKSLFFSSHINQKQYFIHDIVPDFKWIIDEKTTKKILGYNCIKATANFRGSNVTAYFTKEIPYSIGPFKFYGLPGAILDVRVNNLDHYIWRATKVDLANNEKIEYNPPFTDYTKINFHAFADLKDADRARFSKSVPTPTGSTSQMIPERPWLEKIYEWEVNK